MLEKNYFILASASPRRKYLLQKAKYNFKVIKPNIVENNDSKQNAYNKAISIAETNPDRLILACDTIVVFKNTVLNKPKTKAEALFMLKTLNNNKHTVLSSFCIIKYTNKIKIYEKTVKSIVYFGKFSDDFFIKYINTKEPMDKAGAYGIQELGSILVKKIIGSYTNVVGLPMYELAIALQKFNITALI